MAGIALTGALFDLSVCVLCWTEELRACWRARLKECRFVDRLDKFDLFDANQVTLAELEAILNQKMYDFVVLHGIQEIYQQQQLSGDCAAALVNATPSQMIMWT